MIQDVVVLKDSVGQPLYAGVKVAYTSRSGSSMHTEVREITEVCGPAGDFNFPYGWVKFKGSNRKASPYNCTRLGYDGP
jgi:hypothetical protein